jgi:hypothetical protein
MMTTTTIIIGAIVGIFFILSLVYRARLKNRKSEFKDWKVGDLIILKPDSSEYYKIKQSGKTMAPVLGWTENEIYLEIDGTTHKCEWECFSDNKSAIWRRNYESCKKSMGVEPGFKPGVSDMNSSLSGKKIDGKVIELLTEIECEIYLKTAIKEEDYNLAELIRKRMEKFR